MLFFSLTNNLLYFSVTENLIHSNGFEWPLMFFGCATGDTWQGTCDTWLLTPHTSHLTCDGWHLTCDTWQMIFSQSYYTWIRYSVLVSPTIPGLDTVSWLVLLYLDLIQWGGQYCSYQLYCSAYSDQLYIFLWSLCSLIKNICCLF